MDLVDEQDVMGSRLEQGRQVAGPFQHRPRGLLCRFAIAGDVWASVGLARARRAEQQHVVQRLARACARRR